MEHVRQTSLEVSAVTCKTTFYVIHDLPCLIKHSIDKNIIPQNYLKKRYMCNVCINVLDKTISIIVSYPQNILIYSYKYLNRLRWEEDMVNR